MNNSEVSTQGARAEVRCVQGLVSVLRSPSIILLSGCAFDGEVLRGICKNHD